MRGQNALAAGGKPRALMTTEGARPSSEPAGKLQNGLDPQQLQHADLAHEHGEDGEAACADLKSVSAVVRWQGHLVPRRCRCPSYRRTSRRTCPRPAPRRRPFLRRRIVAGEKLVEILFDLFRLLLVAVVRIRRGGLRDAVVGDRIDLLEFAGVGRREAHARLIGHVVGLELGGIEIVAALGRARGYGAHLEGPVGRRADWRRCSRRGPAGRRLPPAVSRRQKETRSKYSTESDCRSRRQAPGTRKRRVSVVRFMGCSFLPVPCADVRSN